MKNITDSQTEDFEMVLKDLWYLYQSKNKQPQSEKERELLKAAVESQTELIKSLTEQQRSIFEKYENERNKLNCIASERAFVSGVSFAAQFMIEALCIK